MKSNITESNAAKDDNITELFYVVVNHEEQHSIWPSYKTIPAGWTSVGEEQSREACLNYIEQHWTDITPKSARNISQ